MSRLTTYATKVVSNGSDCPDRAFARVAIRTKLAQANLLSVDVFNYSPTHALMYDSKALDLLLEKLCPDYKQ